MWLRAAKKVLLQVSKDAQTAGVDVPPVQEWHLTRHAGENLRQKFDNSRRREAANVHDQAAILYLANLPVETRVILDRQNRARGLCDFELGKHFRMDRREWFYGSADEYASVIGDADGSTDMNWMTETVQADKRPDPVRGRAWQ